MTTSARPAAIPPLETLAAEIRRLPATANHSQFLYERLRPALVRAQRSQSQPFFSVRQLAAACGLHPSTVTDLYGRLEADGLLVRVRGSRTLIAPRQRVGAAPHQVVTIPVWLPGFHQLADWRLFLVSLQDEFSRHGAVADFLFYRQGEEVEPAFVRRIKARRPDLVLWHEPHPVADKEAMLRLSDFGLPLVTIRDRPLLPRQPGFWIDRRAAYRTGLREWSAAGIRRLVLPTTPADASGGPEPQLAEVLGEFDFRVSCAACRDGDVAGYLRSIATEATGVVWLDLILHVWMTQKAPEAMHQLYRACRVMLGRSRQLLFPVPPDVRVDALDLDCRRAARRVVRDVFSGEVFKTPTPAVLEYQWWSRFNVNDLAAREPLI